MLAAQVVCTNAYFKQLQSARQSEKELSDEDTIKMLKKLKDTLEVELEKLSK